MNNPLTPGKITRNILLGILIVAAFAVSWRVTEVDFGKLEGLTAAEINSGLPDFYRLWLNWETTMEFPGGESIAGKHSQGRRRINENQIVGSEER